jgi:hypothetical protein
MDDSEEDEVERFDRELGRERSATRSGWAVEGTVGGPQLFLWQLANGWVRVELSWHVGAHSQTIDVDVDPHLLRSELMKVVDDPMGQELG